jgi:hypothetical protein
MRVFFVTQNNINESIHRGRHFKTNAAEITKIPVIDSTFWANNPIKTQGKEENIGTKQHADPRVQNGSESILSLKLPSYLNINLKQGYNGDLIPRRRGSIGGECGETYDRVRRTKHAK